MDSSFSSPKQLPTFAATSAKQNREAKIGSNINAAGLLGSNPLFIKPPKIQQLLNKGLITQQQFIALTLLEKGNLFN